MRLLRRFTRKGRRTNAAAELLSVLIVAYILTEQKEHKTIMAKQGKKVTTRRKPPENETPSEAFVRLATGRTNKAVKAISLIAQLSGSAYESTDVQKRAILTALEAATEQVKEVFAGTAKSSDSFKLPN